MARKLPPKIRISAPVTPFSEKGDFMADAYAEIIRWHLKHGTRGFLVAADNGEHWALSLKEIRQIAEITMRESKGKLPVYVGAWAITEREAIERAAAAAEGGAYGLCVKPQHYVHSWTDATEADVVGRFEAVYKATRLPQMVYNSPNRTGVNITHDLLRKILDVVDADCLKDTSYDPGFISQRVLQFHDKLSVLVGTNAFFASNMMLGAGGFIGSQADLLGDEADRFYDFQTMSEAERRALVACYNELAHCTNRVGTIPAGYKAALNMIGLPAGHLRDPLKPISAEQSEMLRATLTKWGILKGDAAKRAAD
jgi:4-hydroxy-tetrahydrodipicolinate synthase